MVPVVSHSLRPVPMSTCRSISEPCLKLPLLCPGSMTTVRPDSGPLGAAGAAAEEEAEPEG